ncbi:FliO/MopB family protein [Desulfitobacterium sp. Sab5]|uniref:FliO/MopB family protein n=1 Tax=Desulfitobacterium nosdiversum TaxID=3375356 RepID=UPI003CE705AD
MSDIEGKIYAPSAADVAQTGSFSLWGLVGTVLIFIVILVIALWIIRRLNRSVLRGMNTPWARVLDRQILNGQQSLYLVEIAGKLQVLGDSDHYLVKLTEIDDPELAAEILDEIANRPVEKAESSISRFSQRLFSGKRRKPKGTFSSELEQLLKEVEK